MTASVNLTIDSDLVRAIAWCRIGGRGTRPHDDQAFYRAEALGLLAHDPIWRATDRGEGVLVAVGLLPGEPAPARTRVHMLWARRPEVGAPAQFVAAWSDGHVEAWSESYRQEREAAKDRWREWTRERAWLFFDTVEESVRP